MRRVHAVSLILIAMSIGCFPLLAMAQSGEIQSEIQPVRQPTFKELTWGDSPEALISTIDVVQIDPIEFYDEDVADLVRYTAYAEVAADPLGTIPVLSIKYLFLNDLLAYIEVLTSEPGLLRDAMQIRYGLPSEQLLPALIWQGTQTQAEYSVISVAAEETLTLGKMELYSQVLLQEYVALMDAQDALVAEENSTSW